MTTGQRMQLTKQAGEYLVAAECCVRGVITTTFTGNMPDFDILAINHEDHHVMIQVKTITTGWWQLDARRFLDITISSDGHQKIAGKKNTDKNIIYVFVLISATKLHEFFICDYRNIQEIIYNHYSAHLKKHDGVRPKNAESYHIALSKEELMHCKDNWQLITGC